MRRNGYQDYLETEVMSADPLRLVQILYESAIDCLRTARQCLRAEDIAGRSKAISKALAIFSELLSALDHERGGEISRDLARLYDYAQRLLMDANFRQVEAPIAEAEGLLVRLLEAWRECGAKVNAEAEADSRRYETMVEAEGAVCYAG